MDSTGDPAIDLATVGAVIVFCLGLTVGIGGMWLAWRMVRRLPTDDVDHRVETYVIVNAEEQPPREESEDTE